MNVKESCPNCNEPTRYVMGFWDGEKSHGQIYNCKNLSCLVKQENIERALAIEETKRANIIENAKNGISMERVKMQRKELLITTFGMAKLLSIFPSTYSNYEQCREPLPVELVDRIENVFANHASDNYSQSITWTVRFRNKGARLND